MIRLLQIEERFAEALENLQRECFPFLADHELMNREHFRAHCRVFPEGSIVAIEVPDGAAEDAPVAGSARRAGAGELRVVGLGAGFFTDFDFGAPQHSFKEVIAGGDYSNHDPSGDWYYGADISVHPDYRGFGIGRKLYDARKEVVRRFGKRGIVAGGTLPGYERFKEQLALPDYVDKVVRGELSDPTLSFQLANGFEVRGILEEYIEDEITGNRATLIVWEAPRD